MTHSVTGLLLLMGLCVPLVAAPVTPPAADLIAGGPAGPWRRLFLDAMVVEQQEGLQRVFHAARKYEGNPLVRRDQPWELAENCTGPYLYGTVLWDEGKLRMWYHGYTGSHYANAYAESVDGLQWTKPALGLIDYGGSKENNLFLTTSDPPEEPTLYQGGGKCHNPSVIKQPWEPSPARRYALFCYAQEYRHARAAFSADGLRWTFVPETAKAGLFGSSDVLNFGYDPYRSRYYATWKAGSRRGRAAGIVFSSDGLKWSKPVEEPVFVADDLDPDATQIYGMPVFPYQGLYVGPPWIYHARWFKTGGYTDERMYEAELGSPCTMDVQVAWSWDMVNWSRPPERQPFIPRGQDGFDRGMIFTARAPVQVGDELYFYYGGFDGLHSQYDAKTAIGVAMLRLDGFCSMRATAREGRLVSRRERLARPKVTINARVDPGGYVTAELLDRHNAVIPGFSRAECVPFAGDSVRHVLTWKTAELPAPFLATDKKIRFILKAADLYSYLPDQSPLPHAVRYVPAGNGGLLADASAIPEDQRFQGGGHESGYRIVKEGGLVYADLHSAANLKTHASYWRDDDWSDETDWCLETRLWVVDQGTEPVYGLACFMRPSSARNASLYLSDRAVGIMTTASPTDYRVLASKPADTTGGFHWYRLVHSGGETGSVALYLDGQELLRVPYADLCGRSEAGWNITFGPNASHGEGRLHVAAFGYRIGGTDPVFERPDKIEAQ